VNAGVLRVRPAHSCPANVSVAGRQADVKAGVLRVAAASTLERQSLAWRIDRSSLAASCWDFTVRQRDSGLLLRRYSLCFFLQ
jgi:hypothetical protein